MRFTVLLIVALMSPLFVFEVFPQSGQQQAELVTQIAHSLEVKSVVFSPNGKTLASCSGDATIKLWDIDSGTLLRTFSGHSDGVYSVAFSPDGNTLASGGGDRSVKLWDVNSGNNLRTLSGHSLEITGVVFSPDGSTLASGSIDKTIKLWDVASGSLLKTFAGHAGGVASVAFSPDGKTLASASWDKTIKLWNIADGTELRTLSGHSEILRTIAFSPNGRRLASADFAGAIKIWDIGTGSELNSVEGAPSVAFSPDGNMLASEGRDLKVKLLDANSGRELRTLASEMWTGNSFAFSPDGKILASGSEFGEIKLWDVSSGKELRTLSSTYFSRAIFSRVFSPDGRMLAYGSGDSIKLWNLATGELRILAGQSGSEVAFSPDGKTLASCGGLFDRTIKLWDTATGAERRTLRGHTDGVLKVVFSPDGQTLASGSYDGSIKLWNVATGSEQRRLSGHLEEVSSLLFSPDGKTLVSGSHDKTIKLWNVATGFERRTLTGHTFWIQSIAFSPDGRLLASTGGEIKLWDVDKGVELRTLAGYGPVAFSLDGNMLASLAGSADDKIHTIRLWEVATGAELRLLDSNNAATKKEISQLFPLFYGGMSQRHIAEITEAGRITLFERQTRKELASLVVLDEKDWLVVTPDGFFDGSPKAWKQVIWRLDNNTLHFAPVEAFFGDYFRPGLLQEIFSGKIPKAEVDISRKDIRQPQVKINEIDHQPATSPKALNANTPTITVTVEITDNTNAPRQSSFLVSSGAQDVRLFRNGSLVRVWHGDVLKEKGATTLQATIPIVAGENRLTAYAFNRDNIKSSDATLTITGADSLKRKGVAYVLSIGVNEYANAQYNLKYAVADAQDFAEELKRQQAKVNNYERVEVISLNDKEATKANILKSLAELSTKIQPEDALVIFFAGHGTAQQNRFYLIPHDLGYAGSRTQLDNAGLQTILSHSISDEELERAVEGIDAGQMLLVIDACNSGQALEAEEKRRGPMNSKGLAQLAYEKGMYILTAAQSYQAAQEAARLGHGFLTYALVEEGLKTNAADKEPKDGQVLLREWLDYATERVPQMQEDELTKQLRQGRQLDRIKFAETDSGTDRSVQRPRVFYRRETEPQPLVVARP